MGLGFFRASIGIPFVGLRSVGACVSWGGLSIQAWAFRIGGGLGFWVGGGFKRRRPRDSVAARILALSSCSTDLKGPSRGGAGASQLSVVARFSGMEFPHSQNLSPVKGVTTLNPEPLKP